MKATKCVILVSHGGMHSECDIPEIVIRNTWPFDLEAVSRFMAEEVSRIESVPAEA